MKKNAYIVDHDIFTYDLYTENEIIDSFGQEFLDEYGHAVPQELIDRYLKAKQEFKAVQKELQAIKDNLSLT